MSVPGTAKGVSVGPYRRTGRYAGGRSRAYAGRCSTIPEISTRLSVAPTSRSVTVLVWSKCVLWWSQQYYTGQSATSTTRVKVKPGEVIAEGGRHSSMRTSEYSSYHVTA
eukprot:1729035-Rhodomonas_salina.1